MGIQRLRVWAAGIGLVLISGCSGGSKNAQTFAQLPDPNPTVTGSPVPNPSSSPTPSPTVSPTPSPRPTVSPSPLPPTACDSSLLLPWARWSTFSHKSGNFNSVDIRQGVAARDLVLYDLIQGEFGYPELSRVDVAADTLKMEFVDVQTAGVRYSTSVRFGQDVKTFGAVIKSKEVDFDLEYDHMVDLQLHLLDLKVNSSAKTVCGSSGKCTLTIKGTDPKVNRVTVEPDQLKNVTKIIVDVPKKSTPVIVINAKDVAMKDIDISAPNETVWTLGIPSGKFGIDFMTLPGTVVIATSTFQIDQALVMGRVLAKEFVSVVCSSDDSACSTIDSSETPEKICL